MDVIFLLASTLAFTASLFTVTRKNPIYAVAWMLIAMLSLAGIFVMLHATFLGTVQVLLYAGAIVVLFVFVVMLLNQPTEEVEAERSPTQQRRVAALAAVLLGGLLLVRVLPGLGEGTSLTRAPKGAAAAADAPRAVIGAPPATPLPAHEATEFGGVAYFGHTIYDRHLVAFELIAVLVLAAVAAVTVIAKREIEREDAEKPGAAPPPPAGAAALDPQAPALEEARS